MKYRLAFTHQYLKDLKLARKRGLDESLLNVILLKLCNGEQLPASNRDHQLSGDFGDCRECHIQPDWLLIYARQEEIRIIELRRTGTHSDLFK